MSNESKNFDKLAKAIWNRSYDLTTAPNLWGADPVPFISKVIEMFKTDGAGVIIELPCGDGRNTLPLSQNLPFIIAADASPNALQIVGKRLAFHHAANCIILESDVFETKFIDSQFDAVFCWDLLGHLRNPQLAINELLRICKPGKLIIGNVFSLGDSTRGKDMTVIGDEEYLYTDKIYFKYYTEEQVRTLLKSIEAEIVSIELIVWDEPPHEGYREYPHEHQSWAFTIKKPEGKL